MNNQYRENTEHVKAVPPVCTRKYGYMYNIAFVLLFPLVLESAHVFVGFSILCSLVHFTNDIQREFTFFS